VAVQSLWMLCLLLFVDGATVAVFTTPLLLVYSKGLEPWQVATAGGAASAAGSVLQLAVFRWMLANERRWMRRFLPSKRKLEETLRKFPSASFLAIAIARATPLPDAPIKLVAAAVRYPLWRYGIAVFTGALPYYWLLAWAGHELPIPPWVIVALAGVLLAGLFLDFARRGRERRA